MTGGGPRVGDAGARGEILQRIRSALRDIPAEETAADVPVPRVYRLTDDRSRGELVTLFTQRAEDYGAHLRRSSVGELAQAIAAAAAPLGLTRAAVAPGVPAAWLPDELETITDDGLSPATLDAIDAAVTGCAAAIAETGTIILDGGPRSGRRALTLVPDHHICIVEATQIVGQLPEGLAAVAEAVASARAPITLVSGPLASSDIELERVEGVHGPRHLLVLIAT